MIHYKKTKEHKLLYIRTGSLSQNIITPAIKITPDSIIGIVRSKVNYSKINEYGGTRTSRKGKRFQVKARPFLRPALYDSMDKAKSYFLKNFGRYK